MRCKRLIIPSTPVPAPGKSSVTGGSVSGCASAACQRSSNEARAAAASVWSSGMAYLPRLVVAALG